jgi:hypothetical protein
MSRLGREAALGREGKHRWKWKDNIKTNPEIECGHVNWHKITSSGVQLEFRFEPDNQHSIYMYSRVCQLIAVTTVVTVSVSLLVNQCVSSLSFVLYSRMARFQHPPRMS